MARSTKIEKRNKAYFEKINQNVQSIKEFDKYQRTMKKKETKSTGKRNKTYFSNIYGI